MSARYFDSRAFARIAGVGLLLAVLLWLFDMRAFYAAWLFGLILFSGIALGCLGLLLIGNLGGGRWFQLSQPVLAAGALTLPLLGVLAIPILVGLEHAYPWTAAEPPDPAVRTLYRSPAAFAVRLVGFFALWTLLAVMLAMRGARGTMSPPLAIAGLLLYVPSVSLAAMDWVAALEPGWDSSALGLVFMASSVLGALALVAALLPVLTEGQGEGARTALSQLGALMLAALLITGYLVFIQFLVVWSANLPEDSAWYLRRMDSVLDRALITFVIAVASLSTMALLSHAMRRRLAALVPLGWSLLAVYAVYRWWEITPAFSPPAPLWFAVLLLAALAMIWAAALRALLGRGGAPGARLSDSSSG